VQSALKGVNATVVGILLAALFWTSTIFSPADFGLAVLATALAAVT
jgi:chromate transporter